MSSAAHETHFPQTNASAEASPKIDFETNTVSIPVKLSNLPPFNGIASQALALTTDSNADLRQFSDVIGADPAFTADVLFLANSSLFGFPSRLHSHRHAVALLGLERIKALAVTVAMRGFLGKRNSLVHQCWQHSVACAVVCRELADIFKVPADSAYTAGIMHDIGRLSLLKSYPEEMAAVLGGFHADNFAVLEAERQALTMDHTGAGAWLIEHWALPRSFSEVCRHHHDRPDGADSDTLQLLKTACGIADAIGFPAVKCQNPLSYAEASLPLKSRLGRKGAPQVEDLLQKVATTLVTFER